MKFWLLLLRICVLASAFAIARPAAAQCSATTATPVSFGTVNTISGSASTVTGTISVSCTWTVVQATATPYALLCLNLGSGSASTSSAPRSLAYGSNLMQYNLFTDSAHSIIWGSTLNGTTPISVILTVPSLVTGGTTTQNVSFYGQIPANQTSVSTSGNASTVYSETFSGSNTALRYTYFLILTSAPSCASLTTTNGSFAFTVNTTVTNNCNISATGMTFGAAGLLTSALNATASITTQCTNGDAYEVALNGGLYGTVAGRNMQSSAGAKVSYQLYLNSGYTTAWGDGTNGTSMYQGTGTGGQNTVTVYGQVPAQTTPAPGNYSDTVTATISF